MEMIIHDLSEYGLDGFIETPHMDDTVEVHDGCVIVTIKGKQQNEQQKGFLRVIVSKLYSLICGK